MILKKFHNYRHFHIVNGKKKYTNDIIIPLYDVKVPAEILNRNGYEEITSSNSERSENG
jgi:hypothetical protein